MLQSCSKFQSQNVQTYGICLARHKWPKSSSSAEDPVVLLDWNLYGDPLAGLLWERQFEEVLSKLGWEKYRTGDVCLFVGVRWRHWDGWTEAEYSTHVEEIDEGCRYWWTCIILRSRLLAMYSTWMQTKWNYYRTTHKDVWITYFSRSNGIITGMGETSCKNHCVVLWHGGTCSKIVWKGTANLPTRKLSNYTKIQVLALDDHQFKKEELESLGELFQVCWQIVLKRLYLARIGRSDSLWSVNKLARAVTKWTQACDRRWARLIAYIHHTQDYRQYWHVSNTAQHCRLGSFQDSDFAGGLEDSKSTLGGILCLEVKHSSL